MTYKETYFIFLSEGQRTAVGECSLLRGLSYDDTSDYESKLRVLCQTINQNDPIDYQQLMFYPSIYFGLEQARVALKTESRWILFPSLFTSGKKNIPINGLVWMNTYEHMYAQVKKLLKQGFKCLKFKIGQLQFKEEFSLLQNIRKEFKKEDLEIRVDANGALNPDTCLDTLSKLSDLDIHSIEQPLHPNYLKKTSELCEQSPIPIALDEQLIGIFELKEKKTLLEQVKPKYIILKPSLLGGYKSCEQWMDIANSLNIKWWITSALESNIGLNAIAQWTFLKIKDKTYQGLGTGQLFTNNIDSPLKIEHAHLRFNHREINSLFPIEKIS